MNKRNIKTAKNYINQFLGIITLLILVTSYSCEEDPSSLGADLIPDSNKLQYHFDTTLTFKGNVYVNDPVITSGLAFYSLGYVNDEHFGEFKGELAAQFLPLQNFSKDSILRTFDVDSAVLYLEIDSVYGSPIEDLSFNVYELNEDLSQDVDYYSDEDISTYYSETDKINTSCSVSGDTLVRFNLSSAFLDKLISDNDEDTVYKTSPNFLSIFKGLAIIPETSSSTRGLVTINLTSGNTGILLYHNDSLSVPYVFNKIYSVASDTTKETKKSIRFAKYSNNYENALSNNYLTNPEDDNDDLLYLQGLSGLLSKVELTNIDSWIQEDSVYSVLDAELLIPVYEDNNFSTFYPPDRLYVQYAYSDTAFVAVEDFISNADIADGYYNSEEKYYRFNIPKHLMKIMNGKVSDKNLYLNINQKLTYPERVILKSGNNIKLSVTYTKH